MVGSGTREQGRHLLQNQPPTCPKQALGGWISPHMQQGRGLPLRPIAGESCSYLITTAVASYPSPCLGICTLDTAVAMSAQPGTAGTELVKFHSLDFVNTKPRSAVMPLLHLASSTVLENIFCL